MAEEMILAGDSFAAVRNDLSKVMEAGAVGADKVKGATIKDTNDILEDQSKMLKTIAKNVGGIAG